MHLQKEKNKNSFSPKFDHVIIETNQFLQEHEQSNQKSTYLYVHPTIHVLQLLQQYRK